MKHFLLSFLVLSASVSLVTLFLYYLYSFFNPSIRLRYFLKLQSTISFIILLNLFYEYSVINLGSKALLQMIAYALSAVWAPTYLYYTALFFIRFSSDDISIKRQRLILLFAVCVGAANIVPFLVGDTWEQILIAQKIIHKSIIVSTCGFGQVLFSVYCLWRVNAQKNENRKLIARYIMLLNIAAAFLCVTISRIPDVRGYYGNELYLFVLDVYLFLWNLFCIFVLFKHAPVIQKQRRITRQTRNQVPARLSDPNLDADWKTIEDIVGNELFRNPRLSLNHVAKKTSLSINRISYVINKKHGNNFKDYVNAIRIKEFKRIMESDRNSNSIISAAFDAGFNSKTTFYSCFNNIEGESPGAYLERTKRQVDQKSST